MDSNTASSVSIFSKGSRMDLHPPADPAGPTVHGNLLLAPRRRPKSAEPCGWRPDRSWPGWDLAAGQRHGFPTPTTQNSLDYNDEANGSAAGQARPGVLQVCPAKKKFLII